MAQAKFRIRKNDTVMVITGSHKDKGKVGKVLRVYPKTGRVVVEGIRMIKRHTRANPQQGQQGGVVEREGTIHISNLMIVCEKTKKPTRLAPGEMQTPSAAVFQEVSGNPVPDRL
jgi:large subunit ribosomal protein L24